MSKTLRPRWLTCDICGCKKIEVKTESSDEEWLYNDDPARCLDCCTTGTIQTDGEIAWFEADEGAKNAQLH